MTTRFSRCTFFALLASMIACASATGADDAEVSFEKQVAPIIEQHCVQCHKPGNEKGDISLATFQDARDAEYVVPGSPDESYLLDLVIGGEGQPPQMPKDGEPLSSEEVDVLRRWIALGADWPEGVVLRERSKADDSWWSLQPVADVQPPDPAGLPDAWQANEIDRFVYARLAQKGLTPSRRADRRTLIRRATFDLTGLPPTPAEIQNFLADGRPDAYTRLIDRLLASPHYGERWGRHWLDVIRFGESRGFERNQIIDNLWPFRDYVIRSFNEDKPFDDLVREHLAGDAIGAGDPDAEVATAFLVCGPYDDVGNQDPAQAAQIRANTIDEMIRTTAEAFLGLTIGCARCHDHKFDPIRQRDYYALYATLAGVKHGSRVVDSTGQRERAEQLRPLTESRNRLNGQINQIEQEIRKRAERGASELEKKWSRPRIQRTGTEETFEPITATAVRLTVEGTESNPDAQSGYRIDEFEAWTAGDQPRNVAAAAHGGRAQGASRVADDFADAYSAALTIDGRYGARWIAAGAQLTITFARPERVDRVLFSSDRTGDAGSHGVAAFVAEYRIEVSPDGDHWTEVANSHDRKPINAAHRRKRLRELEITAAERRRLAELKQELGNVNQQINAIPALPSWWVGTFEQPQGPFHVFLGGNPQKRGPPVVPASLAALDKTATPFELEPDAAEQQRRVALADWVVDPKNPLTPRVLANRLWHYHFGTGIVDTPSDFGYMGGRPTHPELLDWLARQVHANDWRLKPLHRKIMLSETYRQAAEFRADAAAVDADSRLLWRFPPRRLSAEEVRDSILSVAGQLDLQMGGPGFRLYRYIQDNVATYVPLDEHGPETYRRAVYHQNARSSRVDLMTEFDCPDNAFAVPRRTATTTPLQALTLMNHSFATDMAQAFSQRLEREAGQQLQDQIQLAYELAYGRPPTDDERAIAVQLAESYSLRAFCRAVLNSNEFIFVR